MKLSDLNPEDVEAQDSGGGSGLKLSDVNPNDVELVAPPQESHGHDFDPIHIDGPKQSVWQSVKDRFTKMDPSARAAINGPLGYMAGPVAGDALAAKAISAGTGALERFATSPVPSKVSDATNVVGHGKDFVDKFLHLNADKLNPAVRSGLDAISGAVGRKAAYSNPVTAVPQGISDVAKGVTYAQKGAAYLLDKTPEVLGQYLPAIKSAASKGPTALAATEFLLQQTSPGFQEILKKHRDNQ